MHNASVMHYSHSSLSGSSSQGCAGAVTRRRCPGRPRVRASCQLVPHQGQTLRVGGRTNLRAPQKTRVAAVLSIRAVAVSHGSTCARRGANKPCSDGALPTELAAPAVDLCPNVRSNREQIAG